MEIINNAIKHHRETSIDVDYDVIGWSKKCGTRNGQLLSLVAGRKIWCGDDRIAKATVKVTTEVSQEKVQVWFFM